MNVPPFTFPSAMLAAGGVSPALPLPPQASPTLPTLTRFSCLPLLAERATLSSEACGPSRTPGQSIRLFTALVSQSSKF